MTRRTPTSPWIAVALLCAAPVAAAAQVVETRVSVGAGSATDALGTRSTAVSISPSLLARSTHAAFALGGDAVRFNAGGWAATGNAGLDLRTPLVGGLALTGSAAGAATTTSFDARFLAAQLVPALEGHWGPVQLYAGARAAAGRSTMPTQGRAPSGATLPGGDVTASRTQVGSVAGGGFLLGDARRSGYVGVREERGTVRGAGVPDVLVVDRSLSGTFASGPVMLSATAGARRAPDESSGFGSASIAWTVARPVTLQFSAGRYPSNRLTGTLGGSYVSAGMSLVARNGSATSAPAASGVPGAPAPAPGTTRFAIRAPRARRVELAGDWNDWKPVPVLRAQDGWWYADLALSRGRYRYGFRVDGAAWTVPDGADAVDDGFGGRSAWITVR